MSSKLKSLLLWIFSVVFMLVIAIYQRLTGPTHPYRGKVEIAGKPYTYKLIRTWEGNTDARVTVTIPDTSVMGSYKFKRFKSHDEWSTVPLKREGDQLAAYLPNQPAAGKVMYQVMLTMNDQSFLLNEEAVVLRYKGVVPLYALIPHILFMFLAMVFSMRAGLEGLFRGGRTYALALWTSVFLFIGGAFLGPVVQKFAFNAYWTGWPFGHDLTDNKTALALIAWLIAVWKLHKDRSHRWWAVTAAIVLLAVYLIPHSVLGSEIDYTKP